MGRRSSPSTAPLEDWPCGVAGSGFATEQRFCSHNPRRAPLTWALPSSTAEHGSRGARRSEQTHPCGLCPLATVCGGPTPPRTCLVLTTCCRAAGVTFARKASNVTRLQVTNHAARPASSTPNRLRVAAPKSGHCACGAAGSTNASHAARNATCARAHRPLAQLAASLHAEACKHLQRAPNSAHAWRPALPKGEAATRGTLPRAFP